MILESIRINNMINGSGSPIGVITPDFIGQTYIDTVSHIVYFSKGLTNADWIISVGTTATVQQTTGTSTTSVISQKTASIIAETEAIELVRLHNPDFSFQGFAKVGDSTPAHVANKAWLVVETGTVFGISAVKGEIIYSNGTIYLCEAIKKPIRKRVNLFDKSAATDGYYCAYNSGLLMANAGYSVSDYVSVEPSTAYYLSSSGLDQIAWFDKAKKYISGTLGTYSVTSPATAYYVRFSCAVGNKNTTQFEKGTAMSTYASYIAPQFGFEDMTTQAVASINKYVSENIISGSITTEKSSFAAIGKNLFNKNTITSGYYIGTSGSISVNSLFCYSDYVKVVPSTQYFVTHLHYHCFYDENKVYISGSGQNPTQTNQVITTPSNAYYIRFTVILEYVEAMQVELGTAYTFYEPFSIGITSFSNIKNNKWYGKKWYSLGDSITASGYYQYHVNAYLGMAHTNCGISGTTVSGTAANAFHQDVRVASIAADAQLVTILGGANDFAQSKTIGLISSTNTSEFCGAFNVLIGKLLTKNPLYRIVLLTTTYCEYGGLETNSLGLYSYDYSEAVRLIGKKWGIPVIDLQGNAGWGHSNLSSYTTDSVHPNTAGYKRLAEIIIGKLREIEPLSF